MTAGLTMTVDIGLVRIRPLVLLALLIIVAPAAPATHRHPQEAGVSAHVADPAPRLIHRMCTHKPHLVQSVFYRDTPTIYR